MKGIFDKIAFLKFIINNYAIIYKMYVKDKERIDSVSGTVKFFEKMQEVLLKRGSSLLAEDEKMIKTAFQYQPKSVEDYVLFLKKEDSAVTSSEDSKKIQISDTESLLKTNHFHVQPNN